MLWLLLTAAIALTTIACGQRSSSTVNANAPQNAAETKLSRFESDLETMRTANFQHIFVFRRTDGGVVSGEDKAFLKSNLAKETVNRIILSDDDKAVIAGSNYELPPEKLQALRARFNVEDYSAAKKDEK